MTKNSKKRKIFNVTAVYDEKYDVYFSTSDITGLHIEAKSLPEFMDVLEKFAPDLIMENHIKKELNLDDTLLDLMPFINVRIEK